MASWAHDLILVGGTLVGAFGSQGLSNKRAKHSDEQRSADELARREHERDRQLFDVRRVIYGAVAASSLEAAAKVLRPTSEIDSQLYELERHFGILKAETLREYREAGEHFRAAVSEAELVSADPELREVAREMHALTYEAREDQPDEYWREREAEFERLRDRFMDAARRELGV